MRQLQSWQEWNPILSRSGWMLSAHYYVKMKWPMEGFVSSICWFTISLSAITVTIRWTSEMQRWSWGSLASMWWLRNFVSTSAISKILSLLMQTLKISHPKWSRMFQMPCSIVVSTGWTIFPFLLLTTVGVYWCWEGSLKDCTHYFGLKCWALWEWSQLVFQAFESYYPGSGWVLLLVCIPRRS